MHNYVTVWNIIFDHNVGTLAVELSFPIKVNINQEFVNDVYKNKFLCVWDNPNERGKNISVCQFEQGIRYQLYKIVGQK